MSQHTPGPWTSETVVYVTPHLAPHIRAGEGLGGDDIEEDANARLIAAGPELYEAVRDLLSICECVEEIDERVDKRMIRARAALAKVEGKE